MSADARSTNVPALFTAAVAAEPTRPLLTYYDDATGERTELSGATLANWVAKTANMLVDGYGLGPGDRAAILLPAHWQTAAVLLGAWSAGLAVEIIDPRFADLPSSAAVLARPVEVMFTTADPLHDKPDADDRFVLGLAPMALPLREVPAGYLDYVAEVRRYGDHFEPAPRTGDTVAMPDGTTYREYGGVAVELAKTLGLRPGDRVLVDAAERQEPLWWLLTPLAAGASIVLCANLDRAKLAARRQAERVTRDL
jgi:uncharacterized protein (TIGR03089 family)